MIDQPSTITVPSELERGDGFVDLAAMAFTGLAVWYGFLHGVPVWLMLTPVLLVAVWTLTGEAAADTPYIGAIAAGLRSKLGLRRAHEWCLAYAHYFRVAVQPRLEYKWLTSKLGSRIATWRCWQTLGRISGARLNSRRLLSWRPR